MPDQRTRLTCRDRLTDPWFVLPVGVLAGAVLALSLAIVLEPDNGISPDAGITPGQTPSLAGAAATGSPLATPGEGATSTVQAGATPQAGAAARQRDLARGADAYRIAQAAFAFYRQNRAFPATVDDGIEPLCDNPAVDAGCRLEPYLSPIPMDVRGKPADYGYWYQSAGPAAVLFMSMEVGDGLDQTPCPNPRPPQLAPIPHLFCLQLAPPNP